MSKAEAPKKAVKKPGRLSTVAKALDLLDLLARERREWGVTELAMHLKLSKSVVHGLLVTLQDKHYVAGDPATRRYRLGLKAASLGTDFDLFQEMRAVARPIIGSLTQAAGEESYLMVRQGMMAVTVARALTEGPMRLSVEEGTAVALHAGASGKVILAFSPAAIVEEILSQTGMPPVASRTITARDQLIHNLKEIADAGYAVSESEGMEGIFALAAPVLGSGGIVGSLGLVGVAASMKKREAELLPLLLENARKISLALGGLEAPPETMSGPARRKA
jgi:IclR family transcriptional regulator, KDG regulon repressor